MSDDVDEELEARAFNLAAAKILALDRVQTGAKIRTHLDTAAHLADDYSAELAAKIRDLELPANMWADRLLLALGADPELLAYAEPGDVPEAIMIDPIGHLEDELEGLADE